MISEVLKTIPSVDLADFNKGGDYKNSFVKQLGEAFHEVGFVAVKNHGVNPRGISEMYEAVKTFFELPEEIKGKYEIEGLHGQRGYTSFGKEHARDSNEGDLKEFWHIGQVVSDNDPIKSEYPENIKCLEVPSLQYAGISLYNSLEVCGGNLLRAIALYLNLDEEYFVDKIHNGNSILRAIHYPPITKEPKSAIRAGAHEDINLITLLIGASADGLEILDKKGNWVPVTSFPDHIIVNVGDMLQRLTNNFLKSTTHRVVNPPKEKWSTPRYSIPFFLHPRSEMPLNCLDDCITVGNPKQYDDCTAGQYLNQRLAEIGLKK